MNELFWDDLLGHLREHALIPIVGPDAVTMAQDGRTVTVSRVLAERLAARYRLEFPWTEGSGLHDVARALHAQGESERLYRVVNDLLIELKPAPPDTLLRLAGILDIPLFVTTTFDSLMTRAVDQVRHGGRAESREMWFSPSQSTDEHQKNDRAPDERDTTVFKLFGEASSTPQYALHDEDVLEWLHALLADSAVLPEWLSHRLRENPLLFVGCRIPDWIGRYLVRLASSARLSSANKQYFIVGRPDARDAGLAEFLQAYCGPSRVQIVDADPAEFVAELERRWTARRPAPVAGAAAGQPPARRGRIFVSYLHEDLGAARAMCEAIGSLGGDVWFDERQLEPGDKWEEEILAGIRHDVGLFVALISRNTEAQHETYVFREWAEALKRSEGIVNRRFIVPVVIDGDYDGDPGRYHQLQEGLRALQFSHAPDGRPDERLRGVLTDEIRAMRRKDA